MTREQEIADCKAYIFACEARGNAGLPDLGNREQLADDVIKHAMAGLDDGLHRKKLRQYVREQCGMSPMVWIQVIGFVIQLIRLVMEWRRKKEAGEL